MLHFNKLTPAEAERLAILLEELGEAQHAAGKILRHGYESGFDVQYTGMTNRQALEQELSDVRCAVNRLTEINDLSFERIKDFTIRKQCIVEQFLHHN